MFDRFIQKMKDVMVARISEDKREAFKEQVEFKIMEDKQIKMVLAFGDGEYFSYIYHKCIQKDIKVLSTFEKIIQSNSDEEKEGG